MILREEYAGEAEGIAVECWRDGLAQREQITPAQWAKRERWIAQGASPLSQTGAIRYDVGRMPFCEEPMTEAVNPEVQVMVLQWASGMAKTEVCVNIVGFKIEHSPTNQFIVYPKDESGRKFSRDVLQRSLIDATPAVARCVVDAKSREVGNTLGYKRYIGGSVYITSARSPSNFRGPRAGVVWCDEIDGFPASAGEEGDPILLAFKRAEGFSESIKLLTGTPTFKNRSNIENWFNRSDKRMWFVPCRRCGREQVLMWHKHSDISELQAIVDWPKLGRNRHEKAVILCGHCAATHNDAQRLAMVFDGKWKPTALFNGIRGYWLNGINSTLPPEKGFKTKLHQFAVNAHDAAHSNNKKETVKVWTNTFLAETYQEEQNVKQEWRKLYDRREDYPATGKIPQGVKLIAAGVDFQIDRAEIEIIGWGDNEESWGLGNIVVFGDPRMPAFYPQLDAQMVRVFEREDGARMPVVASGWDTGYAGAQRALYGYLRPRLMRRFFAMKGSAQKWAPAWARGRREERITLFIIGTNRMKTYIYNRATIATVGPGYMHFPKNEELGYNEEWFKQLLAEDSHSEFANGVQMTIFEMPTSPPEDGTSRNEALDKRVYAQAALYIRGPVNWDYEEKRNLATIPVAGKVEAKPQKGPRRKRDDKWLNWNN